MSKHSPGPWFVETTHLPWKFTVRSATSPEPTSGALVAVTTQRYHGPDCAISAEEARANAQLIAAAPDLLKALKEADRLYSANRLLAQAVPGEPLAVGKWIGAVRDAIEKAGDHL